MGVSPSIVCGPLVSESPRGGGGNLVKMQIPAPHGSLLAKVLRRRAWESAFVTHSPWGF